MRRIVCIFLALISAFVFCSCNISVNFVPFEETDTDTSTITAVTTPEVITFEETTPEESLHPEETTSPEEIVTPEETTTSEESTTPEDITSPEKPSDQAIENAMIQKLEMLESIFQEDSREWCVYNDIMGEAVTEVLSKQDLLIAAGCNANDIYQAGTATENLRALLEEYNDLRIATYSSNFEKYQALYQYYRDNYDSFEQNFCDLYKTLMGLYQNNTVANYIALRGKAEHYRQLVGHLYVISTALDRNTVRDEESWSMDRKTLSEVIEDVHYFPDGDWYPEEL